MEPPKDAKGLKQIPGPESASSVVPANCGALFAPPGDEHMASCSLQSSSMMMVHASLISNQPHDPHHPPSVDVCQVKLWYAHGSHDMPFGPFSLQDWCCWWFLHLQLFIHHFWDKLQSNAAVERKVPQSMPNAKCCPLCSWSKRRRLL